MKESKERTRSVGQQECVGNKRLCWRVIVLGLLIVETSTITGTATPGKITLFVLPNPIQVNSVDKAIGRTVELYFIRFNRRLFGK